MDSNYSTEIYKSINEINMEEWSRFIDLKSDIAMDPRLIYLLESTLKDQARFWTIIIRDVHQQIVACACISLFYTDIVQSSNISLQNFIKHLRRYWPNAFKLKVLFCGLPLPPGHTHLRIHSLEKADGVLACLHRTLNRLAKQEKTQLMVFKEMDSGQSDQFNYLADLGYIRGELEPVYQFTRTFKNFKDYQAALRSSYRYQINSNIKKFKNADLKVEHFMDPDEISLRFNENVYGLYLNVWKKAKEKLECFSLEFFRHLPQAFPQHVVFTLISDNEKPVAFAIGIVNDRIYYNLYVGLDYNYLERVDLYFNLFYHELDNVFSLNIKKIYLGQTSGYFKSRLGASPDPRFFWVRPLNPLVRLVFKVFQKWIFPKVEYLENQVFKINVNNFSKELV